AGPGNHSGLARGLVSVAPLISLKSPDVARRRPRHLRHLGPERRRLLLLAAVKAEDARWSKVCQLSNHRMDSSRPSIWTRVSALGRSRMATHRMWSAITRCSKE